MSVTSEFILRCLVITINVTYERWLRFGVHTFGRMDVWTCGRMDVCRKQKLLYLFLRDSL